VGETAIVRWNLARRIGFRFLFCYFSLLFFSTLVGLIPFSNPFLRRYDALWYAIVAGLEKHVLHTGYEMYLLDDSVSISNTPFGTLLFSCYVAVGLLAAVVWSVLDRKRDDYERLYAWLRLVLRWFLAVTMIHYGALKIIPVQMPYPPPGVLRMRVGELAPMRMLWIFVGSSPAYESFTGAAEMLGGVLLLFPRTTLLGALVCFADMVMVVTLNMCYDVHVKLFSLHLLFISAFLIAPDFRRLTDLLIFNRRVEPSKETPLSTYPWLNRSLQVLVLLFGLYKIGTGFQEARERYAQWHPPEPPLHGVWSVEDFVVDGTDVPMFTDPQRWRWVTFWKPGSISVEVMIGATQKYPLSLDPKAHRMILGEDGRSAFSFQEPEPAVLILDGQLEGRRTHAKLRKMPLTSTGFRWIFDPPPEMRE
jgi:uncharacterized membrane protein YphA (DoxX/SURF4 family)